MLKVSLLFFAFLHFFACSQAQDNTQLGKSNADSLMVRRIYDEVLQNGQAYDYLRFLCKKVGARLSGSPQAAAAVEYTRYLMDTMRYDTVYLQPVLVPQWVRGDKEIGRVFSNKIGQQDFPVCALGSSVGTGAAGLTAEVVELKSLAELKTANVKGKIVFFNRPMNPTYFNVFSAYSEAVDQRGGGASEASKYGAVGVIVRSLTPNLDDFPHTGNTRYWINVRQIPAIAISTNGAETLSQLLKNEPNLKFYFRTTCQSLPEVLSYNVVGEIRGSEKPNEIIAVGGHLDSWDLAEGAHDDGTGCVQALEVMRTFKKLKIRPKRTVRVVMFMNEENGLRGGKQYASVALQKNENHIAAIESDGGGFTPRAFGVAGTASQFNTVAQWKNLFEPYGITKISDEDSGGADISPLKEHGTVLIGYNPDSQRYFDYHHTAADTFDKVSNRELHLGAGAMAALVYLLSEYGVK